MLSLPPGASNTRKRGQGGESAQTQIEIYRLALHKVPSLNILPAPVSSKVTLHLLKRIIHYNEYGFLPSLERSIKTSIKVCQEVPIPRGERLFPEASLGSQLRKPHLGYSHFPYLLTMLISLFLKLYPFSGARSWGASDAKN